MKQKIFLISIDTEGDNLWDWKPGKPITTENARFLPRFQALCDRYGFQPTYLTNYEMAMDPGFVSFAAQAQEEGRCEIGMHLHAWNSPPEHSLQERTDGIASGAPYLIEYPLQVMEEKIAYMTNLLQERFGQRPITHRAGRWAMDHNYFSLLKKYGYVADCSVTPSKSWADAPGFTVGSKGTDYTDYEHRPYLVENTGILEIPVTIHQNHRVKKDGDKRIKHILGNYYRAIRGQGKIWLRPDGRNLEDMLYLADRCAKGNDEYLMFMLHSSELMPGGCWRFDTEEKIEALYGDLERLFSHISRRYTGMTIGAYAQKILR